ncbi:HpcH/HpaI aldolase family protein [Halotalea alkalilenta]|uniref:HpcH/HpaI aldolase family protein n=1 Tax=Halotalea alkalilenta TaxID=376489 RepID=UPI0004813539|nr:aldolase/citrate lyase family protein [Halotalea alkalilenta]
MQQDGLVLWMSSPLIGLVEIAQLCGFSNIIIDVEHGSFDLEGLDRFLAFTKAKGISVIAKTQSPATDAIQQVLDFGADAVVVPHLQGVEHARQVTAAAKYPLLGIRSYMTGRVNDYTRPSTEFFGIENRRTRCYAMIETAESLEEVEEIAALDTVDGIFPGPSDLALARGRGAYAFTDADRRDLVRCVNAARAVGKPWMMPAWTPAERAFALEHGAERIIVSTQSMILRQGLNATLQALKDEAVLG